MKGITDDRLCCFTKTINARMDGGVIFKKKKPSMIQVVLFHLHQHDLPTMTILMLQNICKTSQYLFCLRYSNGKQLVTHQPVVFSVLKLMRKKKCSLSFREIRTHIRTSLS